MKRRTFMLTAAGAAMTPYAYGRDVFIRGRDVTYEPDQELKSTGLSIEDGLDILKDGRKDNTQLELREEILDNPDAVFFVYAGVEDRHDWGGSWTPCNDQMERLGRRVSELVFRKGSESGGKTFIKPNMVGGISENTRNFNTGGIVHPYFTCGLVDGLRDVGNSNVAIAARGALRHEHVVGSGLGDLLAEHNLPLIEAHVQYFKDYKRSELMWHKNGDGMVQRRFATYRPAYEKDTRFINLAHAHTHKVGYTTLCMKNIQGVMPRGYGHICDAWTTLDIWRRDLMDDFNRDFRQAIEQSYVRHAQMGYKYWDEGGLFKAYRAAGGHDAFREAHQRYEKARTSEDRAAATERMTDIADTRLFWAEIWAQRMADIVEVLPQPYLNMVEGVFGRGFNGVHHTNFVTLGKSMVAVDAVTTWLMGHDPREVPYLRIAKERGLGENDISKIPIYMLSESGVERLKDYRLLKRTKLGIHIYGIEDNGLRYL